MSPGEDAEALFDLRCPDGPPVLRENYGFSRRQVTRIVADLAAEGAMLYAEWSKIHGEP